MWPRWQLASSDPLWLDELHTGWVVLDDWSEIRTRAAEGNQGPVFFWLARVCTEILGPGEFALRLVSLVSGLALIIVSSWLVYRESGSVAAGVLTSTLLAFDETMIWYSSEARPYSLLMLVGVLQVASLMRSTRHLENTVAFDGPASRLDLMIHVPLVILSCLLVYIHYTGTLLLAAEAMVAGYWLATSITGRTKSSFLAATMVAGLVLLGLLPLVVQLAMVAQRRENWQVVASLSQLVNGLSLPIVGWVLLPGLVAVFRHPGRASMSLSIGLTGLLSLFVFLLLVTAQVTQTAPLAMSRYYSIAMGLPAIFVGLVVGSINRRGMQIAMAALVLLASGAIHWQQSPWWQTSIRHRTFQSMRNEAWKPAIARVNADEQADNWPIFLFAAVIEDAEALVQTEDRFQAYLQFPIRSLYPVESESRSCFAGPTLNRRHFSEAMVEQTVDAGGAWVLIRHRSAIVEEILDALNRQVSARTIGQPASLRIQHVDLPPENNNGLVVLVRVQVVP